MYDFHTHTFLSDGVLSPIELIRRAIVVGYQTMAITDHVGPGNLEYVLSTLKKDCEMAEKRWDIKVFTGVEITHTPIEDIDLLAKDARALGAQVVNVHGETIMEPVVSGTNLAAVSSQYVDILAHPGLITLDEASLAAENGVFLEISGRKGHGLANGHVANIARKTGATLILDSDAHEPDDLMTQEYAEKVAIGSGLNEKEKETILNQSPLTLIHRVNSR
ncbi:MAG: histidinol phosphate phosphatase domain-containing protein [SAR202 cluster bacterium]|jgi:putative hydrolase|nr:MAG: histidinol phosphate phosphatase domain-containing protein [SAR202 cluster bacterium]KAA1302721.1 MAG: histidinol phosphate phosphatase domain-containing protein [SAR202 cluster bacterium]MEC7733463.1 histidinol phosphate phosphatase domain-containing protein [Chloroflexota bacterium]MED5410417.1 histidinol phosphate phosphatase domain-containing protein [Chloroflexota bacterium]MED5450549.1 histidinol phosphate phosphatase domain-containing protein [Chloroflexota bacterium]|tara:strand:+ start:2045 stop:2704 length:660 start_codon:yes stop_codon:yes gene_type:complete